MKRRPRKSRFGWAKWRPTIAQRSAKYQRLSMMRKRR